MHEITQKIIDLLKSKNLPFEMFEHEPTPTSATAAQVRAQRTGETAEEVLSRGAKAMVMRSKDQYFQMVLSSNTKINYKKAKQVLGVKRVSLATAEQVLQVTGCQVGGVPPFGNLFGLKVYLDKRVTQNEIMDFNAGVQTVSMEMKVKDYITAVQPEIADFADPIGPR